MMLEQVMPYLGPVVVTCNVTTIFFCLKPKRSLLLAVFMLAAWVVTIHVFTLLWPNTHPLVIRAIGIVWIPAMLFLFEGQPFQIAFAMFLPYQLGALTTHLADALTGSTVGYQSPYAQTMYIALSLVFLAIYMTFVLRNGRRLFKRIFMDGKRGEWALYTVGTMLSFLLIITLDWNATGVVLYFALILFILWSIGVLCYTIINTHEKTARAYHIETLGLQMDAMRGLTNAEKKHREDMAILRHDMRHEMGIIMELYQSGRTAEAEAVYANWQCTLKMSESFRLTDSPYSRRRSQGTSPSCGPE